MDDILKIRKSFPLLIPSNNFKLWDGIIWFEGTEISTSISTPHFPSCKGLSIMCCLHMQEKVKDKINKYVEYHKTKGFLHLLEYLNNSEHVQEDLISKNNQSAENTISAKFNFYLCNQILNELKQIDSDNIVTCSGDLNKITLRTVDVRGVEHLVTIGIPSDYPTRKPTLLEVDLPEAVLSDLNQGTTILDVFNTFQALVDSLQEFWATYDSLTKNCWVIDPEHPRRRDTHCRVMIGENVSMVVTLNALDVNTCPDIKFLGPNSAVIPFINSMEKKLKVEGWNEDTSLCENLLSLLDLTEFPRPDLSTLDTPQSDECSICFLVRLPDDMLPSKICNNTKCSSYFHVTCLAQWFQAVPTNETSFNLISGDCPLCGERILCPIKLS